MVLTTMSKNESQQSIYYLQDCEMVITESPWLKIIKR